MDKAGFLDRLGRENVCADIDLALARSRELLNPPTAPSITAPKPVNLGESGASNS